MTMSETGTTKRKTFFDRFFGPTSKRAKTNHTTTGTGTGRAKTSVDSKMAEGNTKGDGAEAKKTKPSLEKSRRKEVKERLNAEASKEIRPLAVGTVAMMASALSNQGRHPCLLLLLLLLHYLMFSIFNSYFILGKYLQHCQSSLANFSTKKALL